MKGLFGQLALYKQAVRKKTDLNQDKWQREGSQLGVASSIALMKLFHSSVPIPPHQRLVCDLLLGQLLQVMNFSAAGFQECQEKDMQSSLSLK